MPPPENSRGATREISPAQRAGWAQKNENVLKGRWNPASFQDAGNVADDYQPLRSWLISEVAPRHNANRQTISETLRTRLNIPCFTGKCTFKFLTSSNEFI
jgi:hypothetical protein